MSLRTPLSKVRGLGSAKDGTEHWWHQRVTATALAILGLWFVVSIAGMDSYSHASVEAWANSRSTVSPGSTTVRLAAFLPSSVSKSYHL